jgi:hypothetical protein
MGEGFDEIKRKKDVELKVVEVLVPHFNHMLTHMLLLMLQLF